MSEIFGSVTYPISLPGTHLVVLVLLLVRVGATIFKKAQDSVVSNGIGMKFGISVRQVNRRRLTESDFRFDVTHIFRMAAMTSFYAETQKSAAICECTHTFCLIGAVRR